MAEQVQSGPQQSRARRFLGAGKRTLDGEDRSERIKTGRKGTPFRAFSPTIKPEFPKKEGAPPRYFRVLFFFDENNEQEARKTPPPMTLTRNLLCFNLHSERGSKKYGWYLTDLTKI